MLDPAYQIRLSRSSGFDKAWSMLIGQTNLEIVCPSISGRIISFGARFFVQRLSGLLSKLTIRAQSLGIYAGLVASMIAIYAFIVGDEEIKPPVPVPVPVYPITENDLTRRISSEIQLRLASGACNDAGLRVSDALLVNMGPDQTTHGFPASRITANISLTVDGKTSLLPIQGTGKGPSAEGDAFAALVQVAESRLSETFPQCIE